MKIDPKDAPKVRILTTHEGKFLSLEDMKKSLKDDRVMESALALLKVGSARKADPRELMRIVIGNFLLDSAGEGDQPPLVDDNTGAAKTLMRPTGEIDVTDVWLPVVIKTDDAVFSIKPRNGKDFQVEELNAIVDGHFEVIPLTRKRYMVLNEDGKGRGLPLNLKATNLLRTESQAQPEDFVVGDVLICFQNQIK